MALAFGAVVVGVLLAAENAAGAQQRPAVPVLSLLTSSAGLFPAFDPAVTDYVVRCTDAARTSFDTGAAPGTSVAIDGKREASATVAMHANQEVTVTGASGRQSITYHVRCLPSDFPTWEANGMGSPGHYFVTTPSLSLGTAQGHYVVIFDDHGVPVWWYRDAGQPMDAKVLPNGDVAFAEFNGANPAYQVRRLDGTLVERIASPDGQIDDHELQTVANGDTYYLVYQPKPHVDLTSLGGPADATADEGVIEERSPDGKLVWSWSTDGHVALDELAAWTGTIVGAPVTTAAGPVYDIVHANSISIRGNVVLLSLRYANAIYAIDRTTGAILWKLGGVPTPQSLTVVGDPLGANPLVGQHDARQLADGTVTVFDDGSFVRAPRAVQYRIDAGAHTATFVTSVSDPTVTASACCGSARLMDDGDWLISWGGDSVVGEYAADGTPLLTLGFDGLFSYRAIPVERPYLTRSGLRTGMDAMAKRLQA
ncbi:MAG TPA: arylsulfotransferase family protein [Gaiellaceae bacterium]|nr:arylsulfotransferase family protein [Gaiellaceae bacterium]